jgi:hypothetical protein
VKVQTLRPEYVDFIPNTPQDGVLYISKKFKTASHLCCCGCGTKIVTPLRETEYTLTERGGAVTLRPSIGNWDYPCQSHYLITNNRIISAPAMTRVDIQAGRAHDHALKETHFAEIRWPWWRRAVSRIKAWWAGVFG